MLMIICGTTAEMGGICRNYLIDKGFILIEKYYYAHSKHRASEELAKQNVVSESEFLENTDSLFRYEIEDMLVGFNQQQVSDAVCDKVNGLLTLSNGDISFLSEIKRVYADKVCIVYTYIDDSELKNIVKEFADITEDEATVHYETICDLKQSYLQHQDIFDHVVIYGGEKSVFSYQSLYLQFDSIIQSKIHENSEEIQYADVFVSYTRKDANIYRQICSKLTQRGITVFDDLQLGIGTNWESAMVSAIQNAKIVISVITENSVNNDCVMREIMFAIENAEKNGSLIIPIFVDDVELEKAPNLEYRISTLSCVFIKNSNIEEATNRLADRIYKLLSAEADLKAYSKQVENYLCLKMYEQAKRWQEAHLSLCDEIYVISNGRFLDFQACIISRVKLISILIDMQLYVEALKLSIEALDFRDDEDTHDILVNQFTICCAYLGMDVDSVRKFVLENLSEFGMYNPKYSADNRMQRYLHSRLADILETYQNVFNTVDLSHKNAQNSSCEQTNDEEKIAQYGELAIALFENIIQKQSEDMSRHDLIIGYERILNYCKHMGINGAVADKCISRIAELSSFDSSSNFGESSVVTEALKIYLGQVLPKSGEYDVFLSYKSEDEVLAKKVYDYLTQSGKEVFFAKETLPQLGESEYEKVIFEAIDHSRHMILIGSNPDYLKTPWVRDEWSTFNNEIREGRKNGNLLLILTDDIALDKGRLPGQIRQKEIIRMSEFRNRLLSYLR